MQARKAANKEAKSTPVELYINIILGEDRCGRVGLFADPVAVIGPSFGSPFRFTPFSLPSPRALLRVCVCVRNCDGAHPDGAGGCHHSAGKGFAVGQGTL